ncbi:MAG: phosphate signaling complex protein PhoU [Bacteroidota bacterium]|nr:phosphate signaling complex protein PhoU [Bacteroidota bacterium]
MTHLDTEIQQLKIDTLDMWALVQNQLSKCKEALTNFDSDLSRDVVATEKRVNAYELKLDRDCENIIALFNPVAIDLRFVLSVLKINSNLERIGDVAESISKFVIKTGIDFDKELLKTSDILKMFETAEALFADVSLAFENEDTRLARKVFKKDEILKQANDTSAMAVTEYIKQHPDQIEQSLHVLSIIRKLDRVGDLSKSIAEEIIFYVEAKVLKHIPKKEKIKILSKDDPKS